MYQAETFTLHKRHQYRDPTPPQCPDKWQRIHFARQGDIEQHRLCSGVPYPTKKLTPYPSIGMACLCRGEAAEIAESLGAKGFFVHQVNFRYNRAKYYPDIGAGKVQVRSFFFWSIVPSLLLIVGCSRHDTPSSSSDKRLVLTDSPAQTSFVLTDIDGRTTTLSLHEGQLRLSRVVQPQVLLHFFSTRADLCRAMLPYLSDLQRKESKHLFVLGIVVPETINTPTLRTYMHRHDATFFISHTPDNRPLAATIATQLHIGANYPLPLTVLFDHGRYITHYEGITPTEMIRNDLHDLDPLTPKE